jgi:hypothetical protein
MAGPSSDPRVEAKFRRVFRTLLGRAAAESVDTILAGLPGGEIGPYQSMAIGLTRDHFWRRVRDMRTWPEAKVAFQLAHRAPLQRLTRAGDGTPLTRSLWLLTTLLMAVERYCNLTPPGSGYDARDSVALRSARITRVANEVVRWAKLEPIPVRTRTLLLGVTALQSGPFRIDPSMTITTCNMGYTNTAAPVITSPPACFVTHELLREDDPPTVKSPESFVRSLQLVLNSGLVIGDSETKPDVPYFSAYRFEASSRIYAAQVFPIFLQRAQLAKAKRIMKAFEDLHESGFDLALDLYSSFLHEVNGRERAANIAVALENLYLAGVGMELSYRFRLHVVRFGRYLPREDRIDLRAARDLYSARSTVVHGDGDRRLRRGCVTPSSFSTQPAPSWSAPPF